MNEVCPVPFEKLEKTVGYDFRDKGQLRLALTHSSYGNEKKNKQKGSESNERLEFLGDSVLSFLVSRYLYETFPDLPEGDLSRIRPLVGAFKKKS